MKIKLYKHSGIAFATSDSIEQSDTGFKLTITGAPASFVEINDQTYVLRNGCATIARLERGNYQLSVHGDRDYGSIRFNVENNTIRVLSNMKNIEAFLDSYDKLKEEYLKTNKKIKEIEERISGYSLFGD